MFEKNLKFIDNLALKERLTQISLADSKEGISYCVTPTNDYILLKEDVPIDDLNNPRKSAQDMLKNSIKHEMKKDDIIILFGIGLGYLLDETFQNYNSRIYLYEPDINLLHFVLNNIDISEHLASGRIYITNDLDELLTKVSSTYINKDRIEVVYLPNYAIIKHNELLILTQKIYETCKSKMVDVNTITKFSKIWMSNTIYNLAKIKAGKIYALSDLENLYAGQTALIIGAGPSLKDNIDKIKANRNKFIIFAVNKIAKFLFENNITPDYIVCLDALHMKVTLGELKSKLSRTNCIMDVRTDFETTDYGFNKIFYNFSESDFFMAKIKEFNPHIKQYESGGSASTLALVAAAKMGFSKIVFTGLDLAFKDDTIYATGEVINETRKEQIQVNNTRKNLVKIKSVTGNEVYTREDYQAFIYHFEELLKYLNYKEAYNTTEFGAYIEGMKNVKFDEIDFSGFASNSALDKIEPLKIELKDFTNEEFYNINNIISVLSKGIFSPELVSSIVKSVFVYQYIQSDVVSVLQKNFDQELAEKFIANTKSAIRNIVELLQKTEII